MIKRFILFLGLLAVVYVYGHAQQPFYFIMLTDPQFGMYSKNQNFVQETANYEFAAAAVNRLKPAFVIVLGDLVNKPGDATLINEYLRISHQIDASVPLYNVAGNHDVRDKPTPESLEAYRKAIGRDYYSFRAGPVYGIVINSTLIQSPENVLKDYEQQDTWLKAELEKAKTSGAKHIIVFEHHPCFLKDAQEPDQYFNIPLERRRPLLDLFHKYDVRHVFAGHLHMNNLARDGQLEIVATGPVGKPLGKDGSGIRIAAVTDTGVEHRYYEFGMLPEQLTVDPVTAPPMPIVGTAMLRWLAIANLNGRVQ